MNISLLKHIIPGMVLALATLASCSTDGDTYGTTIDEAYINSATLGTLRGYGKTTKADGSDSTYTFTVTGSSFPLSIDQVNNRIYNITPLPYGTDLTKVVFSNLSYVGGTLTIEKLDGTKADTTFNSKDSTDFSTTRMLNVYTALDESTVIKRTYSVELSAYGEDGSVFKWQLVANVPALATATEQRTMAQGDSLYVFCHSTTGNTLLTTPLADPTTWRTATLTANLNVRSIVSHGSKFYALDMAGNVLNSTDGHEWTATGSTAAFNALAASSACGLLGITPTELSSSTDGISWVKETLDESQPLPTKEVNAITLASRTNANYRSVVITGYADEGKSSTWKRDIDLKGTNTFEWNFMPNSASVVCPFPSLRSTSLFSYDGGACLIGLNAADTITTAYCSNDFGRQWTPTDYSLPALGKNASISATSDADNRIWLLGSDSGNVWRGRLNRLGRDEEQSVFRKSQRH